MGLVEHLGVEFVHFVEPRLVLHILIERAALLLLQLLDADVAVAGDLVGEEVEVQEEEEEGLEGEDELVPAPGNGLVGNKNILVLGVGLECLIIFEIID